MTLTRRQTLFAGAALPFAGAALSLAGARPAAAQTASPATIARDFAIGDFRVTTLLAGTRSVDNPHEIFGLNVEAATFAEVSAQNFLPVERAQFYFTPTVVNTGSAVILFDTGLNAAGITGALASAGYAPGDITHVVITHMHGDHIGGLSDDAGNVTFANAEYVTGQVEFDHWAAAANEGFEAKVRPLADQFQFIGAGAGPVSGITAVDAAGHTPGHMSYMIESGGAQVLLLADSANHFVYSLAYPDWEVRFDMDKAAAAATRRTLLGMAAADRFAVIGYHMPFPGMGFVETRGDGFHYVPVSYQL